MIDILPEIIITVLALLFGSFVLSSAGFGIALAASPLMLIILDPKTTVVVINTVSLAVFVFMIVQNRSQVRFREMTFPIIFGMLGVPFGLLILDFMSSIVLGIFISVSIIGLGIYVGFYRSHTFISSPSSFNVISFVVGALLTSTGIGGPLMAIAAVSRNWERDSLRGSLPLYYLVVEGTAVSGYIFSGMFTKEAAVLTIFGILPAFVGFVLATIVVKKVAEAQFRTYLLAVIISAGVISFAKEISTLF